MVSVCLPSDALLQHLPSYLGFSYLGRGVSLHGCSSKAQPLLLTFTTLSIWDSVENHCWDVNRGLTFTYREASGNSSQIRKRQIYNEGGSKSESLVVPKTVNACPCQTLLSLSHKYCSVLSAPGFSCEKCPSPVRALVQKPLRMQTLDHNQLSEKSLIQIAENTAALHLPQRLQ